METKLTILLLKQIQIELNHYLLIGLDPNGKIYRFQAVGLDKPNSKNRANLITYGISEIEVFLNRKHDGGKLKRANLLKAPKLNTKEKIIFWETVGNLLSNQQETSLQMFSFLEKLGQHNELDYHIKQALWLIGIFLKTENYKPIIDECVVCKTKQEIATFSLEENGLLCKKHKQHFPLLDSNFLRKIISFFGTDKFEDVDWEWNLKQAKIFLKMLVDFCDTTFGTYFYPFLKCF